MFIKTSTLNIQSNLDKSLVQAKKLETKEQRFGQLTLLIESIDVSPNYQKIIKKIEELLVRNYYGNDKMLLSEEMNSLKIEAFFESSLVKTSKELIDYIDKEEISIDFKKINLTVCLVYEGEIFLSNSGDNKSFLLRKVKKELELSDINPEDEEEDEEKESKIFSSIINGEIPTNSYIIIINPTLSEYLQNKEMLEILDRLSLESAKEHIRSTLKKINSHLNFAGIIIKNSRNKERIDNQVELSDISRSEKETQKILEKTGNIDKKKLKKKINSFLSRVNIFSHIYAAIKRKRKENIDPRPKPVIEVSSKKNKKKIIIIILILIAILAISILIQSKREENKENEIIINNIGEEIKTKQNEIETLLIYKEEEAISKIQEVRRDLDALSEEDKESIEGIEEIEEKLRNQENRIRKMTEINNPKELTDLKILSESVDTSSLSLTDDYIYVSDKEGKIYSINLSQGISSILESSDNIKSEKILSKTKDGLVYLLTSSHLITINENNEINYKETDTNIEEVVDFDLYLDRLYTANTNKQIYRYDRGDKFENPTEWLKEGVDNDIVRISTDYDIEILFNNGSLSKYEVGEKKGNDLVSLKNIDPELKTIDKALINSNNIYLLDKENKRIVIFDKSTGELLSQYSFPNINDIRDFSIDTEDGKIYILSESKLYEEDIII